MSQNIIASVESIVKIRPNLWQASDGSVIGYGAILAPGGYYFCFTCGSADCEHTTSVDEAWVSGEESAEEIPFDGTASGLPVYECQPCAKRVELTPADMYGEDLAVCECGRFYTPVVEADDYAIEGARL